MERLRDDATSAILEGLRSLSTEMERYIGVRTSAHGIHRTDLHALGQVMDAQRAQEVMTPGRLAKALHLSPPATSALLNRLESAGHVHRQHEADDRRRVAVGVSDEAMRVGREIFAPLGAAMTDVVADFTPAEREVIRRFLTAAAHAAAEARD